MKIIVLLTLAIMLSAVSIRSQRQENKSIANNKSVPAAESSSGDAAIIAKAAVSAHGGDNLTQMRSFLARGTVDVTGAFSYVIPATFMMVVAGDRYAFELNNPFQPLRQVYDGESTYSSGYELPPVTSLGFPLLTKIYVDGYRVSVLPEPKKMRIGFRITTPEGFFTDFVVNPKSGLVKGYESRYDINGRIVTTSVEIDEFETVKGIVVPERYSQRFDLGQMTAYANFKTKQILINSEIDDSVFEVPTKP